jgi:hypothetical protein
MRRIVQWHAGAGTQVYRGLKPGQGWVRWARDAGERRGGVIVPECMLFGSSKAHKQSPTDRKGKCFFVPYSGEIEYEEVEYEKPEVILDRIEANVAELRRLLGEN